MLVINSSQMQALRQASLDAYAATLTDHCRSFSPALTDTLDDAALRAAIRHAIATAQAHGFSQKGPLRFFVDMTILLGSGFDTDPQYPWVARNLAETRDLPQMQRADALHEACTAWLQRVDGKDNVHTLEALSRLKRLVAGGVPLESASFAEDTLRLMRGTHPRKVEATGEPALRALIDATVADARARYGFEHVQSLGLMVVLAFAFGHRFATDPFHPWIARTLERDPDGRPDAMAERLKRRALVWLDAVLARRAGS